MAEGGGHYRFDIYVLDEDPKTFIKQMHDAKSAALFALKSANEGIVIPAKRLPNTFIAIPGGLIKYIYFKKGCR